MTTVASRNTFCSSVNHLLCLLLQEDQQSGVGARFKLFQFIVFVPRYTRFTFTIKVRQDLLIYLLREVFQKLLDFQRQEGEMKPMNALR